MIFLVCLFLSGGAGITIAEISHVNTVFLYFWPVIKPLDTKAQVSFLVGNTFHVLSHIVAGRIKCICVTILGEDMWKLAPDFSWTSSHAPFSFANFNPHLIIAVSIINFLSPVINPFSEPSSLSVVLETHNAAFKVIIFYWVQFSLCSTGSRMQWSSFHYCIYSSWFHFDCSLLSKIHL